VRIAGSRGAARATSWAPVPAAAAASPNSGDRNGSKTPPPLATGDVVRMTVEGIGTIENTVGARREAVQGRAKDRHTDSWAPSLHRLLIDCLLHLSHRISEPPAGS
jgi:hypothetical protein